MTITKARPNVQLAADQGLQEAAAQYVWNKVHGKPMREIARAKKALRTTGAVLVVSKGMKRAVVLHPTGEGDFKQATVISDAAVHMMVLQSTVRPIAHGRITKYVLSEAVDGSLPIEAAATVRLLDSPMENLARRKDHEGRPFLERDLIKAWLRLHEEFRLTGCEEQIETY